MPSSTDDDSPLAQAFNSLVSPETLDFLYKTALHPRSPIQLARQHSTTVLQKAFNTGYDFAVPYLGSALDLLSDQPEIVSFAAFAVLIVATWIVVGWIRRVIAFATRLVFGAIFWALVAAVIMLIVQNGVWESARQGIAVAGKLAGIASVIKDVWVGELRRYENEARGNR